MMITSSGMRGDAARCREMGISAYLTKPVKQSSLLDAILTVLGESLPEGAATPLVTQHTLRRDHRPLRVLLAEDNAVNRRIVEKMLGKRGLSVVAAGNGREALAALDAQGETFFDFILMDVQMPEMDGIEATTLIREKEKKTGSHVPIIALTAHAMKGDREACLQAGMDGYVTKPLKAGELLAEVNKVVRSRWENAAGEAERNKAIFEREVALASVDGDMELMKEVVGLFLEQTPASMAKIRNAIEEGNGRHLNRSAHALKGSLGYFGARRASDLALRLELLGKKEEFGGARDAFETLEDEMGRLTEALEEFAGDKTSENTDSGR